MTAQLLHRPKCASQNVVFSKKRNVNVCEDCGHEFAAGKAVTPLRIFLSYGQDANEELVRRIKADLEKRGHDEMLARNAQRLPDWLGLVVTSRPEFDVKTPLQALNPFPLDTRSESNRADIRDYLRCELATQLQNRSDADRLVEQKILSRSASNASCQAQVPPSQPLQNPVGIFKNCG